LGLGGLLVITTVASRRHGLVDLKQAIASRHASPACVQYQPELEIEITHLEDSIASLPELAQIYNPRWLAIQLLENDEALLAESRKNWKPVTAMKSISSWPIRDTVL
jgi:ferrous iron transport protein B